jgi:crossover junction endodeoxyribonuclease RuvC
LIPARPTSDSASCGSRAPTWSRWHEPKALALEDLYFGRNVRSAMTVGQACGVALLAAGQRGVGCFAYTPQAIKMAVCGSGAAGKKQVQRMVGTLLGLPEPPASEHAADALAVAICHAGGSALKEEISVTRVPKVGETGYVENLTG